jgi:hypothetical protein
MGKSVETNDDEFPSQCINKRIKELVDWRGVTLAKVSRLIEEADAEVVEKWKG